MSNQSLEIDAVVESLWKIDRQLWGKRLRRRFSTPGPKLTAITADAGLRSAVLGHVGQMWMLPGGLVLTLGVVLADIGQLVGYVLLGLSAHPILHVVGRFSRRHPRGQAI